MNTAPQYSLRWNNYVNHVTDAFNMLRSEDDLVDVTLCCDGGKIKAHKMLLSVCSNYFKQIFKENPCKHPVIIFKNVKFEDLNAIINFMYHGEVNIFQEQLESFLITAELLEVKGLTDNNEEETSANQLIDNISLDLSSKTKPVNEALTLATDEPINLATIQTVRDEYIPQANLYKPYLEEEETEVIVDEPFIEPIVQPEDKPDLSSVAKTKVNPEPLTEDMQVDNQSTSAEDLSERNSSNTDADMVLKFRCNVCPKGFKHPTSLTLHKDSHAGKTQCPVCHRSFSRSYDMRSHLQRIHQGKQLTIKEIRYKGNSDAISSKQFTHHI